MPERARKIVLNKNGCAFSWSGKGLFFFFFLFPFDYFFAIVYFLVEFSDEQQKNRTRILHPIIPPFTGASVFRLLLFPLVGEFYTRLSRACKVAGKTSSTD